MREERPKQKGKGEEKFPEKKWKSWSGKTRGTHRAPIGRIQSAREEKPQTGPPHPKSRVSRGPKKYVHSDQN